MKKLSDFKKELTIGSMWECKNSSPNATPSFSGTRKVLKLSSTFVAFELPDGRTSRLEFPKAVEVVEVDGVYTISGFLNYKKVS